MVQSKFSDLHGRSIGGSLIKTIREKDRGTIEIQTLTGSCYDFPNLTHVYPKLDAKSAKELLPDSVCCNVQRITITKKCAS